MLNDYIRRSDVLKLFDEWGGGFAYIEVETDGAIKAVNDLPSAQPESHWIPCSERLPEEIGTYLVTLEYKEHGTGITTLWFHGSLGWDLRVADVVTAWMPLPKPWKGGQDGPIY